MLVKCLPIGSSYEVITAKERYSLWEAESEQFRKVWPEYNSHGKHSTELFLELLPRFSSYQFLIFDHSIERAVARGRAIPFCWDGSLDDLPRGMDALRLRIPDDRHPATALAALAAEVSSDLRGNDLSRLILQVMAECARAANLQALVVPVRPNWKDRYPLIPMEQYANWKREDGLPFDPWMRVHSRLGASILRAEEHSLNIEAPVSSWESWTGMVFPADGAYTFPAGLAPLVVENGVGSYWEPNVWMQHPL